MDDSNDATFSQVCKYLNDEVSDLRYANRNFLHLDTSVFTQHWPDKISACIVKKCRNVAMDKKR